MTDRLDEAMRLVEEGADRIETQARLTLFLEYQDHPLAEQARRLLCSMREAQVGLVKRLLKEEEYYARSTEREDRRPERRACSI